MLGWHLHLPKGVRLPGAQWNSLESVVRAMGLDTARYIDIALETLGLVNVVSEPVIISKMGLVPSSLTNVAFVKLVDNRQAPAKLRTLAMALWTRAGSDVNRDNNMAVAVTEIIRRVFTEELA
jgi:antitoxin component of RelBE/YafQ-DinJ toxin-antitoxin module